MQQVLRSRPAVPADRQHAGMVTQARGTTMAILSMVPPRVPDILSVLTPKEREVTEFICMGYTNKDIAKIMFISENTVKDHTKKIYPKMGVHSRFELATLVSKNRSEDN